MAEFFRGWKRKVGIVTLVIACLFAVAWVRSSIWFDQVAISCGGLRCLVVSGSQKFQLVFHQRVETSFAYFSQQDGEEKVERMVIDERGFENLAQNKKIDFYHHRGHLLEVKDADREPKTNIGLVPYLWVVIPLTVLSACLLLGQPRKPLPELMESRPHAPS